MLRKVMQQIMAELAMKFSLNKQPLTLRQNGATLILMVFIIGLLATAYAINFLDAASIRSAESDRANNILANAKIALIGYSLARVGAGERPGAMPSPDRLVTPTESPPAGGAPNYDGAIDFCTNVDTLAMNCLGRLPWQALGMQISNPSQNDELGLMPWYAVSANLISVCLKELNPNILNYNYLGAYPASCPGVPVTGVLPYPWLTVRDIKGNVLSNRAAMVLILPRAAINGQSRPSSPLNSAASYLDAVTVPAGCNAPCVPGLYSNSDADNDYIAASDATSATTGINDRILYITIDELMVQLVKRAAGEASFVLNRYKAANAFFPYAAPLGSVASNFIYSGTSTVGMLPVDATNTCTCTSSSKCTCAFSLVNNVVHTRISGATYSSNSAACSRSARTCTCTGAGTCSTGASPVFSCLASGNCTYTGAGASPSFTYSPKPPQSNVASATLGCILSSGKSICTGAGSFNLGLNIPSWFKNNKWQEYFYYQWNFPANIQSGTRNNIEALIIGASSPILSVPFAISKGAAQTRPSVLISDYLDSAENTDGNLIFDAPVTPLTARYNDQTFIVAP